MPEYTILEFNEMQDKYHNGEITKADFLKYAFKFAIEFDFDKRLQHNKAMFTVVVESIIDNT
jgi:hypothetical protein